MSSEEIEEEKNYEVYKMIRDVRYYIRYLKKYQSFCFGEIETPFFKIGEKLFQYPLSHEFFNYYKKFCKETPFGNGEKTIYDERVRKGWQITPEYIKLDHDFLQSTLREIEKVFKKENVEAEFYKMLIYEKDGHFQKHKDTLRSENHFGTLLIFLPSEFEGGDFILYDQDETKSFNYSINDPKNSPFTNRSHWLAFYTDLNHEISPVKSGYRCVLSYNLYSNLYTKKIKKRYDEMDNIKILYSDEDDDVEYYGEIPDFSRFSLPTVLNDIFLQIPTIEYMFYILKHSYSHKTMSLDYLRGNDYFIYNILRDDFILQIIPIKIYKGFYGEEDHFSLEFIFQEKERVLDLQKFEMILENRELSKYEKDIIPISFSISNLSPSFAGFYPNGNEGGMADLHYTHAGFMIKKKEKMNVVNEIDVHFHFE